MRWRSATLLIFFIAAAWVHSQESQPATGYSVAGPTPGKVATPSEGAAMMRRALARGDRPYMSKLARARNPEPFLVADVLLRSWARARLEELEQADQILTAAVEYADLAKDVPSTRALPAFVAGWKGLDLEALRRQTTFGDRVVAILQEIRSDLDAAIEKARAIELDSAEARRCPAIVSLFYEIGQALRDDGRPEEGERAYLQCDELARRMGWLVMQLYARHGAIESLEARGERRAAARALDEMLPLSVAAGDVHGIAARFANLGSVLLEAGDYEKARELAEHSVVAFAALGDERSRIAARAMLGDVYTAVGEYGLAVDCFLECRQAYELWDQRTNLADALVRLGTVQGRRGEYAEALTLLDRALAIHAKIGNNAAQARTFECQGLLHAHLRMSAEALDDFGHALAAFEAAGDPSGADSARGRMAGLWIEGGEFQKALDTLGPAIERETARGNGRSATSMGALTVEAYRGLGDDARALARAQEILAAVQNRGDRAGLAAAKRAVGEMHARSGDLAKAAVLLAEARDLAAELGDRAQEAASLACLAAVSLRNRKPEDAMRSARAAVELRNRVEGTLGEQNVLGLRDASRDVCTIGMLAARASMNAKNAARASILEEVVRFVENGRAWTLANEILTRDRVRGATVSPEVREEEALARIRVATLQKEVVAGVDSGTESRRKLREDLDGAYRRLTAATARVQQESRAAAAIAAPAIDLTAIRKSLPAGSALVSYQCDPGPERGDPVPLQRAALAVVITATEVACIDLGDPAAIARDAKSWLRLVRAQAPEEAQAAASLYDALMRPLERVLAGVTSLSISPDGDLALVPFEALLRRDGERQERLVERLEVAYVPSGTVLAALASSAGAGTAGDRLVAFADPVYPGESAESGPAAAVARDVDLRGGNALKRLPGTADEVKALARFFPSDKSTLRLRDAASLPALLADLGPADRRLFALHLACHGVVDSERPRLTGLVLSGGDVLTLDAIYGLSVPADLVVLSACDTGRGSLRRGEGMIGLARGFLTAGAPRVVVSNWKVEDRSTERFMVDFYKAMRLDAKSPCAALRAVKLARLSGHGAETHPYHWAAFVLWGLR